MVNDYRKMTLVTGPDGFVGTEVCGALLRRNHLVRGAQWTAGPIRKGCESVIVGDINKNTNWQSAFDNVDTVVHLAARVHVMKDAADDPLSAFREVNVEGTRRLADCAAAAGVQHFIFVSSIKVNGESTDEKPFTEKDTPNPENPYSISKWEAEQLLREIEVRTRMSVTILRPPLIYGPGVKANFMKMIQFIEKGMPLPLGSVDNKRSLLGLGNFVDLICLCVEEEATKGETFVVSDGQDLSTPQLIKRIGKSLKKKPLLLPIPVSLLHRFGQMTGSGKIIERLTGSLTIDSYKVRSMLNWRPPYSVEQEFCRIATWYTKEIVGSAGLKSTKEHK